MGCQSFKAEPNQQSSPNNLLKLAIETNDPKTLHSLLSKTLQKQKKNPKSPLIDQLFLDFNSHQVTLLSYSLIKNSSKCYELLTNTFHASVELMESNLSQTGILPSNYLCEKGYLDLLKLFISNSFLKKLSKNTSAVSSVPNELSPIQLAVQNGHIAVVNFIANHSQLKKFSDFCIHSLNSSGENCAFVAVRSCNFPMIKLLFESFEADFNIKNFKGETVLHVLAEASVKNFSYTQLECLMYLAEIVKVDVGVNCTEVLSLLKNHSMVRYLEQKLELKGIYAYKDKLFSVRDCDSRTGISDEFSVVEKAVDVSGILGNSSRSAFSISSSSLFA